MTVTHDTPFIEDIISEPSAGVKRKDDIVNICEKETTEAPVTMASDNGSQRRLDASAKQMLAQNKMEVKKVTQ